MLAPLPAARAMSGGGGGVTSLLLLLLVVSVLLQLLAAPASGQASGAASDAAAMQDLSAALSAAKSPDLGWTSPDHCTWRGVTCSTDGRRVTAIQIGKASVSGTLPASVANLTSLTRLELQLNQISGPLPPLKGMSQLQVLLLHNNLFTSIPPDFFSGMSSLQVVSLDHNPFGRWAVPDSLADAATLVNFSANSANLTGPVPGVFAGTAFPSLNHLALANNDLRGPLPAGFGSGSSSLTSLWLNQGGDAPGLSGGIEVVANMTNLVTLWLHSNNFTGPIPDLSALVNLNDLHLRDNRLTGPVPPSLLTLPSLGNVSLTNNLLQGPVPVFPKNVTADVSVATESFCLPTPGTCDPRVNTLLSIAKSFGYPLRFAENWKGNDPCAGWLGISCDPNNKNIRVINFKSMGLSGVISPDFSLLPALQKLLLSGNNITGSIPASLTNLTGLNELDVSNNSLTGPVPLFRSSVLVNTNGNPDIGKLVLNPPAGSGSSSPQNRTASGSSADGGGSNKNSSATSPGAIIGYVIASVAALLILGLLVFCIYRKKKSIHHHQNGIQISNNMVVHPRHSGSGPDLVKVSVAGSNSNGGATGTASDISPSSSGLGDAQVGEPGSMVISIQVLRNVTNNFSEENILGRGGFGTVYKGELHDGTKIAVKRMESGVMGSKGLAEFQSEIAVLTKVRHRNLVSLLGYCLDGNERLLVYEFVPQGTLSHHLFEWKENCLKPLEWKKRLSIALDVARGVEYLHSLAHQSFIHRDLKPSNILLGDDMKAKVADFGLVRHAPDGKCSVETRLAGTFGYLAPEYAVTGRVTTKADVFSFGVILMELITGRKALDDSLPEESAHLVTWFRRMQLNKDAFQKAIDPIIDLDEETLASINTVAELAGHCCAREPYQRPDMGHAVNVLSSLSEIWKPSDPDSEESYGIDLDMTLPQALKKWQESEDSNRMGASSSFLASLDNTQSSIPTRPIGFAESFTSADGR